MLHFIQNDFDLVAEPLAIKAWAEGFRVFIELHDERIISFPASRFIILSIATESQLKEVKIRANGKALRWDNLDEDITIKGIIAGSFQI